MFRKFLFALCATGLLAGCYAYPAGYAPYGGYPAAGVYGGYPYYGGYEGGVIVGRPDYGRERYGYFSHGRPGDDSRGFRGRSAGGFSHPGGRPGGFGGAEHGGGGFHGGGGGGFLSHH